MRSNFERCLSHVLVHEGGWADHPRDPGGATMKGVTLATFRRYRPGASKADLRSISNADLQRIYRDGYWAPLKGDSLPKGPDLAVFDFGVNSGVSRSARYSQAVAGAPVDGIVGPITVNAIKRMPARTFIKKLCAKRLGFLRGLAIWNTFGKGWSRRVASVEATALSWVSSKTQLEQDAKQARDKSAGQAGGAIVAPGGGVAVDQSANLPVWALVAIVGVVMAVLIIRSIINAQRARALSEAAKEA